MGFTKARRSLSSSSGSSASRSPSPRKTRPSSSFYIRRRSPSPCRRNVRATPQFKNRRSPTDRIRRRSYSPDRRSPVRDRGCRYKRDNRNFRMERERERSWYNRDRNFNDNRNCRDNRDQDQREMDRRRMSTVDRRQPVDQRRRNPEDRSRNCYNERRMPTQNMDRHYKNPRRPSPRYRPRSYTPEDNQMDRRRNRSPGDIQNRSVDRQPHSPSEKQNRSPSEKRGRSPMDRRPRSPSDSFMPVGKREQSPVEGRQRSLSESYNPKKRNSFPPIKAASRSVSVSPVRQVKKKRKVESSSSSERGSPPSQKSKINQDESESPVCRVKRRSTSRSTSPPRTKPMEVDRRMQNLGHNCYPSEAKNKITEYRFVTFKNNKNNCWLDATLSLIAYNSTIRKIVSVFPQSIMCKIICTHDEAMSILNDSSSTADIEDKLKMTKGKLLDIQTEIMEYLQQFMKNKFGEPDSCHSAFFNLILKDQSNIKEHLNVRWLWKKLCLNCKKKSKSSICTKPIITLCNVKTFHPESPKVIYRCSCETEQEMQLIYKELPSCLIFHFEKGAGDGENLPLNFNINDREYQLTGLVVLVETNDPLIKHFISAIRDTATNMWLTCNDLEKKINHFSLQPKWKLQDVYICIFESFDNLGKINIELPVDDDHIIDNLDVKIIDLSDDDERSTSENLNNKTHSIAL